MHKSLFKSYSSTFRMLLIGFAGIVSLTSQFPSATAAQQKKQRKPVKKSVVFEPPVIAELATAEEIKMAEKEGMYCLPKEGVFYVPSDAAPYSRLITVNYTITSMPGKDNFTADTIVITCVSESPASFRLELKKDTANMLAKWQGNAVNKQIEWKYDVSQLDARVSYYINFLTVSGKYRGYVRFMRSCPASEGMVDAPGY